MRLTGFAGRLLVTASVFASAAFCQGYYGGGPYPNPRGGYERRGGPTGSVLEQTRADLDRAARDSYYFNGKLRHRFEKALRELDKFQGKLSRGKWDNGAIDRVVDKVAQLTTSDRLRPQDRQMLNNDLFALREFRSRRGIGGGYGYR